LINVNKKEIIYVLVVIAFIIILSTIQTGFDKQIYFNSEGVRAKVISADNSTIHSIGLVNQGEQRCLIEIETGSHKGNRIEAVNLFTGKYEFDKVFEKDDKAWVLFGV